MAAAKASAERNVSITSGWLTCSRTLCAWRHVTLRMHASRLSLHENLTRHHRISITAIFEAWAILCVITKKRKRIFARVSQRVSQCLTRRCLTQWQLYAHSPRLPNLKLQSLPLFPHSNTTLITRLRTSASSIITTRHSNLCGCSLHAWAAAAAPRAAARARARQREKTPLQFAFHGRLQVDS